MSMNLHIDYHDTLWPTPTWLTRLALYNSSGNKRHWQETRHVYFSWLRSRKNGVVDKEKEMLCAAIDGHIKEIESMGEITFFEG